MATVVLRIRETSTDAWYQVFTQGGWKVRDNANASWIDMGPDNTKVRSSDNSTWLDAE